MTRIQIGQSSAQIMGKLAPAADIRLAAGAGVYFPQHNLLWQEPAVEVRAMSLRGGWDRMRAGLPVVMLEAVGPGTISFSHDAAGEIVAVPLPAGRHGRRAGASTGGRHPGVGYDWFDCGHLVQHSGDGGATPGRRGRTAQDGAGHGRPRCRPAGGATQTRSAGTIPSAVSRPLRRRRRARAGARPDAAATPSSATSAKAESILVKPPALLFKDPTVGMQLHVSTPQPG